VVAEAAGMTAGEFLAAVGRRLRLRQALWLAAAALVVGALVVLLAAPARDGRAAATAAMAAALATFAVGVWRVRAGWRAVAVAQWVEARVDGLDNLLVTRVASAAMPGLSPAIRDEITRQADHRAASVSVAPLVPLVRPMVSVVMTALMAAGACTWVLRAPAPPRPGLARAVAEPGGAFALAVTVTPPAYVRRAPLTVVNPDEVRVPAGGTVRVVVRTGLASVALDDPAGGTMALARGREPGTVEHTWSPTESLTGALVGRRRDGTAGASRLLAIVVEPDQRPAVRVTCPGRDLRVPTASATIDLEVESTDDHGVSSLELRYVRMAGSGESFTFGEGRVPLTDVTRTGTGLRGRLAWPLGALALEAGESLVYRVVARDEAPGAPPGESESYTIDVGAAFETSGAGAAVAEEDRRYAISQQMVIVKTEQALAERAASPADGWLARTQGLAAEQRMVRAEVVFLSGGEVQDEVEEAAHGDELQEGRLENRGRAEMQRALAEMSRAEAQLTAGDGRGALVFERRALAALLQAFDRRRYFLRTVPERSRIDVTRRLTGDRRGAVPGVRLPGERLDALAIERALLLEIAAADPAQALPAALAARVAALAPGGSEWSRLAAHLLAAPDELARRVAVSAVAAALLDRVHDRLAPDAGSRFSGRDLLDGLWAVERRRAGAPR